METFKVELSEENRKIDFIIDPEDAYLELRATRSGHNSLDNTKRLFASIKLTIKKFGSFETESIIDITNQENFQFETVNRLIPKIDNSSYERITLELLDNNTLVEYSISFEGVKGRKMIDMNSPWNQFDHFISNRVNSKILFSAPFGSGKSTFLDHFFHDRRDKVYNVFTLYPVNYSVASNEDIFKYIKADILLQLLATDIEFDKESISFLRATEEYIYLKPKKAILSFLDKVSSLHPKTEVLSKALKKLNVLSTKIRDYKDEQEIDDKDKAIGYIKEIYDKEGSLFEDNFFTELIKQLLEKVKVTSDKHNVLIIEDLDRMDPDHIFRILNVISAHYDTFKFSDEDVFPNKFGFDKIIIVCDLNNIRSIYHHKYGVETEFQGYINKYFSSKPFEFSNLQSIRKHLEQTIERINNTEYKDPRISAYGATIRLLLESNQLTLREMLKLMNQDFELFEVNYPSNSNLEYGGMHKTLSFLTDLYGVEELNKKFTRMQRKPFKTVVNYDMLSLNLLVGLGTQNNDSVQVRYNGHSYKINCKEHINYPILINLKLEPDKNPSLLNATSPGNPKKTKFNKEDFIELVNKTLIEIVLNK